MMGIRNVFRAALLAVCAGLSVAGTDTERRLYSTDVCISVIAIAGSPDPRYLQAGIMADEMTNLVSDNTMEEEFVCELESGKTVPIKGTYTQMKSMKQLLNSGELISAETTIGIADDQIVNDGDSSVYLPSGDIVLAPRNEKQMSIQARRKMLKGGAAVSQKRDRKLVEFEGTQAFLVVRVTDSAGRAHPDSADMISDNIFGTSGDPINLKTQMAACSFNKLRITNTYSVDISKHLSAPGVININIPIQLSGNGKQAVRDAIVLATEKKLGFSLPGPFDHVMYVLEDCYVECGWAAYAYVNSWLSIYQSDNYKYVGVQMHEIGHNLNMAHSGGLDGQTYTDHTCLMGNPYYTDDSGIMCYNAAKNFQMAIGNDSWYNDNAAATVVWDSGTVAGTRWAGTIIGIADYENNPDSRPVVVKIESGTADDLFVGFNRARGINSQTKAAPNQVTVHLAGNDGVGYATSFLRATLSQGTSYTVPNWRGSGVNLVIQVKEINLSSTPGYADVQISFGNYVAPPTIKPTIKATPKPSKVPTMPPSTVKPTPIPIAAASTKPPTRTPTRNPTPKPSISPTSKPTTAIPVGTCGNSVCSISEGSSTCPLDCAAKELLTTFDFSLGSKGNMFTVKALRDISVTSLVLNSVARGAGSVKVYTRNGSYRGYELSNKGWTLVHSNSTVTHSGRGQPTEIGAFKSTVTIKSGVTQSFFVTSSIGLAYNAGTEEGALLKKDGAVIIYEGVGTTDEFSGSVLSPRTFGGVLRYDALKTVPDVCGDSKCSGRETSVSCPADCADKELLTSFDFSLGSSGNMFSIKALRDISVTSLVLNSVGRGDGAVKVYTRVGGYRGYELSSDGWTLVYSNSVVTHAGRGQPTEIGAFSSAVSIYNGVTQSFFVTSSIGLAYSAGTEEGAPLVNDDSVIIYQGIGTTDEFSGSVHSPRVFSGIMRYDLV